MVGRPCYQIGRVNEECDVLKIYLFKLMIMNLILPAANKKKRVGQIRNIEEEMKKRNCLPCLQRTIMTAIALNKLLH